MRRVLLAERNKLKDLADIGDAIAKSFLDSNHTFVEKGTVKVVQAYSILADHGDETAKIKLAEYRSKKRSGAPLEQIHHDPLDEECIAVHNPTNLDRSLQDVHLASGSDTESEDPLALSLARVRREPPGSKQVQDEVTRNPSLEHTSSGYATEQSATSLALDDTFASDSEPIEQENFDISSTQTLVDADTVSFDRLVKKLEYEQRKAKADAGSKREEKEIQKIHLELEAQHPKTY